MVVGEACMVTGGVLVCRGHAWLWGGVHSWWVCGCRGMHGCGGACVVAGGVCMVVGGCMAAGLVACMVAGGHV